MGFAFDLKKKGSRQSFVHQTFAAPSGFAFDLKKKGSRHDFARAVDRREVRLCL